MGISLACATNKTQMRPRACRSSSTSSRAHSELLTLIESASAYQRPSASARASVDKGLHLTVRSLPAPVWMFDRRSPAALPPRLQGIGQLRNHSSVGRATYGGPGATPPCCFMKAGGAHRAAPRSTADHAGAFEQRPQRIRPSYRALLAYARLTGCQRRTTASRRKADTR